MLLLISANHLNEVNLMPIYIFKIVAAVFVTTEDLTARCLLEWVHGF